MEAFCHILYGEFCYSNPVQLGLQKRPLHPSSSELRPLLTLQWRLQHLPKAIYLHFHQSNAKKVAPLLAWTL